jgi:hypothetical protein
MKELKDLSDRWNSGMPVTIKQASQLFGISYGTMLQDDRTPGFPVWHGLIFPEDFRQWRQKQFDQAAQRAEQRPEVPREIDTKRTPGGIHWKNPYARARGVE